MADDESPLIGLAHKVFDTLDKWGANKDVEKSTPHSKAIDEMNKRANDKTVQDANDSFRKRGTTLKTTGSTTAKKPPAKKGKRKQGAGK